jgi:hypothetical protein
MASNIENVTVILSSRNIIDNAEENESLIPETNILEISPLNQKQLKEFIKQLCEKIDIKDRIFNDLKNTKLIDDVSSSPIAAIILVELLNVNSQDLPSNLTELYSKYLEIVLGRWDLNKGLIGQKEYDVTETVILNISYDLIKNVRRNLSYIEFQNYFDDYIKKRNYDFSSKELAKKAIKKHGVLYLDKDNGTVNFKHRTFIEYFCSKRYYVDKSLKINEKAFNPYWMNVYFFYLGLIKDCSKELEKLINIRLDHSTKELIRIIKMSDYILASYNTETEVVTKVLFNIINRSSNLYNDIVNGKYPDSYFMKMSKINLLSFFQLILRSQYGYKFYHNCLLDVYDLIDKNISNKDNKMVAEILVSLIGIEIKNYTPLECFLDEYKSDIDVELKFLLLIEGEDIKEKSNKLRRVFKNIRRSVDSHKKYLRGILEKDLSTLNKKIE